MLTRNPVLSQLQLMNSMSRSKQVFTPRNGKSVKIFTCGPSIYRRPHVGNYRTFLYEDVLLRYLEYLGFPVERIINITDIEDKSIAEAKQENTSVQDLVTPVIDTFLQEAELLHIKLPDVIPRSSTTVDEVARLISTLMEKGYAYRHDGNIYFDPLKFRKFGRLFGLDMKRWPKRKVRFSKDTYPGQRWNLGDFILWHGYKGEDTVYWDTEIGKGRPSWNVQDPAIITKHLGYEIDIHCGGIDNIYRHHDYNIAVVEAVSGKELAPFWLHGQHLIVDGQKMSKEKGNVVYPEDLLQQGYSGEEIRFFLIYGHYRKKKNLTGKNLQKASEELRRCKAALHVLLEPSPEDTVSGKEVPEVLEELESSFITAMNNDLHVQEAFDALSLRVQRLAEMKKENRLSDADRKTAVQTLRNVDQVLQVLFFEIS